MKPSPVIIGELGRRLSSRLFLASAALNSASKAATSEVGGHPGHLTTARVTSSDCVAVEVDVATLLRVEDCVGARDSVDNEVDVDVDVAVPEAVRVLEKVDVAVFSVFLATWMCGTRDSRIAPPVGGGNATRRYSAASKIIAQTTLAW